MDAPLLIEAPVKDAADRVPAWVRRADWSSNNTLLAFWSAHPLAQRSESIKLQALLSADNFRERIRSHRREQSALVKERRALIRAHIKVVAEMKIFSLYRWKRKKLRKELIEGLVSIRAKLRVSRNEVRRCIKYLRAIEPKKVNHFIQADQMVSKSVHVIVQKPQIYTVISLWQPWASMVAWGLKQYETRHWATQHRGTLLIHAAKRWTEEEKRYCFLHPFNTAIRDRLYGAISDFPFGAIIAVAELVSIHPTATLTGLTADERAVGNFAPGRYAWKLANVRELSKPIPVKGGQGLFKWTGVIDE